MVEDLRIVKTKEAIKESFFKLLKQQSFESITVKQIISEARISKGTFYYHYLDKFDLAQQLLDDTLKNYNNIIQVRLEKNEVSPKEFQFLMKTFLPQMALLLKIKTDEFNTYQEISKFLNSTYTTILSSQKQLAIKNPNVIACFLTSVTLTQLDLVEKSGVDVNSYNQLLDNIDDFIRSINFIFKRDNK